MIKKKTKTKNTKIQKTKNKKKKTKKTTAYSAKRMPKQKTISNSNSISILGIPSTDSRHNGKMQHLRISWRNPCIWRLDFCQIIKSCSCFWMDHKSNKFVVYRFMTSEGSCTLILPFTSQSWQSVAQNRRKIFNRVKRRHILAFYRPNFRLQTKRVLEIELNEQEFLPFFIDFYLVITDTDSRHPRFSL